MQIVVQGSTESMRSFQSFLLVVILALLQCQGVPIEDFFPTNGLSSSLAATSHFPVLATACGGVAQLDVCLHHTSHLIAKLVLGSFLIGEL